MYLHSFTISIHVAIDSFALIAYNYMIYDYNKLNTSIAEVEETVGH